MNDSSIVATLAGGLFGSYKLRVIDRQRQSTAKPDQVPAHVCFTVRNAHRDLLINVSGPHTAT